LLRARISGVAQKRVYMSQYFLVIIHYYGQKIKEDKLDSGFEQAATRNAHKIALAGKRDGKIPTWKKIRKFGKIILKFILK
jgi:hypothetical protein